MSQGSSLSKRGINVNQVCTRQTDAPIEDGGPALEQHCNDVSPRQYSQPRALQDLLLYLSISLKNTPNFLH